MKPQYIFTAVFAVSLLLGLLLPNLAQPSTAAPQAAASSQAADAEQFTAAPQAAAASQAADAPLAADALAEGAGADGVNAAALPIATVEQAPTLAPTTAPAVEGQPAATDAAVPESAPAFSNPPEGFATPTPLVSSPYVIPLTASHLPELEQFAASLVSNNADQLTGVYVPGLLAVRVVAQPAGDESFVSSADQELTHYQTPAHFGSIGLLAHNYLTGKAFFQFKPGQQIALTYGDGRIAYYKVNKIEAFQALSPHDIRSDFVDLSDPQMTVLNYSQVFDRIYTRPGQLVFQTCIEANGELSWGRIFVLAEPINQPEITQN